MGDISRNFSWREFECPHCRALDPAKAREDVRRILSMEIVDALQRSRDRLGRRIDGTSGYRCPVHNAAVGGVPDSAHTKGLAFDLKWTTGRDLYEKIEALVNAGGFRRLGINPWSFPSFIHADLDGAKPAPTIWIYEPGTPHVG